MLPYFVIAAVASMLLVYSQRAHSPAERGLAALLPFTALAIGWTLFGFILEAPIEDWNAVRLTPAISITRGFDMYYGPDSGPFQVTLYGPFTYLAYLPTALFSTPTPAVTLGVILTMAFILVPLCFLVGRDHRAAGQSWLVIVAVILFGTAMLTIMEATRYHLRYIHADSPALALGLLSCMALVTGVRTNTISRRRLILCALFAVMSVWSKQIMVGLVPALLVFIVLAFGVTAAIRFALWFVAIGVAVTLVFLAVFGFMPLYDNMFVIPAAHSWRWSASKGFLLFLFRFVTGGFVVLVILATLIRQHRRALPKHPQIRSMFLVENSWILFVFSAVCVWPTSYLGYVKIGGFVNNDYPIFFLVMACTVCLLRDAGCASRPALRRSALTLLLIGLGLGTTFMFIRPPDPVAALNRVLGPSDQASPPPKIGVLRVPDIKRDLERYRNNPQRQAYEFARAHPGEVYYPWHILPTLMAEGSLYHFDYAVRDRNLAGRMKWKTQHLTRHLPPGGPKYIAVLPPQPSPSVRVWFPTYTRKIDLPELPGWNVYVHENRPRKNTP